MEDVERMRVGNREEREGKKKRDKESKREKKDGNKPSNAVIFTCDF